MLNVPLGFSYPCRGRHTTVWLQRETQPPPVFTRVAPTNRLFAGCLFNPRSEESCTTLRSNLEFAFLPCLLGNGNAGSLLPIVLCRCVTVFKLHHTTAVVVPTAEPCRS